MSYKINKTCKICGSELSAAEANSRFCKTCGSKVEPDENEAEVTAHYYHVDADIDGQDRIVKRKRKFTRVRFIAVALACIVLLAASGGIFFVLKSGQNPDDKNSSLKLTALIEPSLEFQHISYFSEGLAVVSAGTSHPRSGHNQRYGYIDMTGKVVISLQYDWAHDFREGVAAVSKGGKWGFIDKTGDEVLPMIYDGANPFNEGLAPVSLDGKWGYIDISGEFVIPLMYDHAQSFMNGLAVVYTTFNTTHGTKCGLIDMDGDIIVPIEYDWIWPNNTGGFYQVQKDGKQGLIDMSGNVILECIYDSVNFNIVDGTIQVQQNGKWGIFEIEDYETPPFIQYGYGGYWW